MKFLPLTFIFSATVLLQFVSAVQLRILAPPDKHDLEGEEHPNACNKIQANYIKEAFLSVSVMAQRTSTVLQKRPAESPPSEPEEAFLGDFNGEERTKVTKARINNVAVTFRSPPKLIDAIRIDSNTVTFACDNTLTAGARVAQTTQGGHSTTVISLGQLFFGTKDLTSHSKSPAQRFNDDADNYIAGKKRFVEGFTKKHQKPPAFYGFTRPTSPAAVLMGASQLVPAILGDPSLVLHDNNGGIVVPFRSTQTIASLAKQEKKTTDSIMTLAFLGFADAPRFETPSSPPPSPPPSRPGSPSAGKSALKEPSGSKKSSKKVKIDEAGKKTKIISPNASEDESEETHSHFHAKRSSVRKLRSGSTKRVLSGNTQMLKRRGYFAREK